jgi:hypothetical protein
LEDICVIHRGLVADTLPSLVSSHRFCFMHVDVDLYQSTHDCLRHVYPVLPDGAPIVFDEFYGAEGEARAVAEHVSTTREIIHLGPVCQAVVYKRGVSAAEESLLRGMIGDCEIAVSFERLRNNRAYQVLLNMGHTYLTAALPQFRAFINRLD